MELTFAAELHAKLTRMAQERNGLEHSHRKQIGRLVDYDK